MCPRLIIFQGWKEVKKRTSELLIKKVKDLLLTKRILVIPWSTESKDKAMEYKIVINDYLSDNGFHDVEKVV
jgi:hypothetical protein